MIRSWRNEDAANYELNVLLVKLIRVSDTNIGRVRCDSRLETHLLMDQFVQLLRPLIVVGGTQGRVEDGDIAKKTISCDRELEHAILTRLNRRQNISNRIGNSRLFEEILSRWETALDGGYIQCCWHMSRGERKLQKKIVGGRECWHLEATGKNSCYSNALPDHEE